MSRLSSRACPKGHLTGEYEVVGSKFLLYACLQNYVDVVSDSIDSSKTRQTMFNRGTDSKFAAHN